MPDSPNKLSQFWQELKRRRVIQVIFVYATAAFMILEAVDIVFPRLNFPDWTITFVMILLAIGFPIAVIFSWIFDYTPKGIMRTKSMEDIRASQRYEEKKDAINDYSILWSRIIPWSLTVIVAAAILLLWIFRWNNGSNELPVFTSLHVLPEDVMFKSDDPGAALAFSPDAKFIVYSAYTNDTSYLYRKKMDDFEAEKIAGTEGGYAPFFSPDGNWIGFFTDGKLKKVSMLGGAPQVICETYVGYEGCWGDNNMIVYCDFLKRSLWQVSADGGAPVQLTSAMKWSNEEIDHSHLWPVFLPGSKAILYTTRHNAENMRIVLYSFDNGESKTLVEPGSHAIYLKTGHLVYAWKGDLLAVPFDLKRLEVTGEHVMVLQNIKMIASNGLAHYSISDQGSIAFLPGKYELPENFLYSVGLDESYELVNLPSGAYQNPVFSPDGNSLIITAGQEKASTWVYGMERGTFRRFTDKEFESFWAIWTPDGNQIVFNSNRHGGEALNLFMKQLDGTGPVKTLTTSDYNQQPKSWSSDGAYLIYVENNTNDTGYDIYMINTNGSEPPVPLLNTRFQEFHPNLSPDGRWLAYVSDEPGRDEVFICTFPKLENRTPISNNGGTEPVWAPDGKRLYYRDNTGEKIMVVPVETEPDLLPGIPSIVFEGNFKPGYPFGRNYDLSPDGQRFLIIKDDIDNEVTQIRIIANWSEELDNFFNRKNGNK